ncbi:MAG: hypothetical protein CML05_15040 [Pseudozobellia sp.]|nr:hypothetical protein [Pseudozobellia sp.]
MKYFVGILLLMGIISSCSNTDRRTITDSNDYDRFLTSTTANKVSRAFELWSSKAKEDSTQLMSFGIIGGEYSRFFQNTGDIKYLKKAEAVLTKAVDNAATGKSGYFRSLARNYMAQHRFMEALVMADSARATKKGTRQSRILLFDVHMELGNYQTAEKYLDSIQDVEDFAQLVRLAKWNDYKGDLSRTIKFMEEAMDKAEDSKNKSLQLWSYTQLADYYGHAKKIEKSYELYLKALAIDPANANAKKGIAWIVFSHENRPREAMRILDSVTKKYKSPDFFLLKAEIADYMGDDLQSLSNLDMYFKLVSNPDYGNMYNTLNVAIYLHETGEYEKALRLAKKEVQNRPTPEAYSLLAYSYLKKGDFKQALDIIEREIEGKTFDPEILFYAAEIYKATGQYQKVGKIKRQLKNAIFELGPLYEQSIANL